mmetsp:Transcript_449/g.1175  ORF Transcript_449/g.1175 Transcript_449/m.1175 type:complete len:322 (-) Transcript_449:659-1624(-)
MREKIFKGRPPISEMPEKSDVPRSGTMKPIIWIKVTKSRCVCSWSLDSDQQSKRVAALTARRIVATKDIMIDAMSVGTRPEISSMSVFKPPDRFWSAIFKMNWAAMTRPAKINAQNTYNDVLMRAPTEAFWSISPWLTGSFSKMGHKMSRGSGDGDTVHECRRPRGAVAAAVALAMDANMTIAAPVFFDSSARARFRASCFFATLEYASPWTSSGDFVGTLGILDSVASFEASRARSARLAALKAAASAAKRWRTPPGPDDASFDVTDDDSASSKMPSGLTDRSRTSSTPRTDPAPRALSKTFLSLVSSRAWSSRPVIITA